MPLPDTYVQSYGQLPEVFRRISEGQAPDKFSRQHLKDLGFASSNSRAVIPLLKDLGFLAADGTPTSRYHDYRDHSRSRAVLGTALREAYADLFTIKANPTTADRKLIEGKFKSTHNASERLAQLMASTFYSLLSIADLPSASTASVQPAAPSEVNTPVASEKTSERKPINVAPPGLHYNIQIHLPATKDVEVFNAIFKSLREHLID